MGKFVVRPVKSGLKFDLKAANGERIAASEAYTTRIACMNGIKSVIKNAPAAAVDDQTVEPVARQRHPKFEIYQDHAGEFRFRLKATNGQVILASEGYAAKASCEKGVQSVKKNAVGARIEVTEA